MSAAHPLPAEIPRRVLLAGGGALCALLVGVGAMRLLGHDPRTADARTIAQRSLRFDDLSDGGIAIVDAVSGARLEVLRGEQGFVRGTLRGLLRERKRLNLPAGAPLLLIARADGRLTLADTSTGQRIDLESFGSSNTAVFARWLELQPITLEKTS